MKKLALTLCTVLAIAVCLPLLATSTVATQSLASFETQIEGLPQLPLLTAIAAHERMGMSWGTCAKIRPVANHSDCTYSLCEDNGCGAPFHFDPIDCACYCGYAF